MSNLVKVLIVDDHPMMRGALRDIIKSHGAMEVCGEAETAAQVRKLVKSANPQVVLMDIALPDANGIDVVRELKALYPKVLFLVFSMHDEATYALRALRAGASGYVMKTQADETLIDAISQVLEGKIFVNQKLRDQLLLQLLETKSSSPVEQLSDRELEVFRAIGEGKTTRQIAGQLNLSLKTIQAYRERIKTKLGIENANSLVQQAAQWMSSNL